jgi:predicted nucleic acid-binding protein
MLIIDTDAASVLAKGKLLEETLALFENHEVLITPKIEEELEKPLEHGYNYPEKIFEKLDTEPPSEQERKQYRERFNEQSVDKGELEAIAIAESRDAIFFTMDQAAARHAEKQKVQTLSFNNLAKLLHEKEIISKEYLKDSIELIEQKDNRKIDTGEIFQEEQ